VLRVNTQEGMLIRKEIPFIFANGDFIWTPFLESALQISEKKERKTKKIQKDRRLFPLAHLGLYFLAP